MDFYAMESIFAGSKQIDGLAAGWRSRYEIHFTAWAILLGTRAKVEAGSAIISCNMRS